MKHYDGLPKRVRVGNLWFDIELVSAEVGDATGGFYGASSGIRENILIREEQSPGNLADTFIHEVMHCILTLCEADDGSDRKDEEEFHVTHLAHGLCRFWQDNPKVMIWWSHVNSMELA
ncbi:hypothetical protein AB6809_29385 [Paraburkholderia sp. RCC_158]|uniref:hypothetical protein n=1 Tax=Paraburkholderia sp. RCC_158 TaxID=3239220 RepID=UPI0035232ADF